MFVITMIVCVNISLKAHSSIFVMYVGHSKSNAICSVFCVFLSDRGNVYAF